MGPVLSKDLTDLLKVLAATVAVFAVGTLVLFYVLWAYATFGSGVPGLSSLPLSKRPDMFAMLADGAIFKTFAAAHVTASGIALLLTSRTIDMALLITSKAVAVVITALLGFILGRMVYLRLTANVDFAFGPLLAPALVVVGFLVLSSLLSVYNLRALGNLRFVAGAAMILVGPLLLGLL
jgi:hypothetical protein